MKIKPTSYLIRAGGISTIPTILHTDEIYTTIIDSRQHINLIIANIRDILLRIKFEMIPLNTLIFHILDIKYLKLADYEFVSYSTSALFQTDTLMAHLSPTLTRLNDALARLDKFERRLYKGILKPGDWFPYVILCDEGYGRLPYIRYFGIPDTEICTSCGYTVNITKMTTHQKTIKCINNSLQKRARDNNYVLVEKNGSLRSAAMHDMIDNIKVATKYDVYVPKWILEAQKTYIANHGFSGMKLSVYLNKLSQTKDGKSDT